jgi:hypothetical protein
MHGNCHCNEGLVDCDFEALPYLWHWFKIWIVYIPNICNKSFEIGSFDKFHKHLVPFALAIKNFESVYYDIFLFTGK